MGKEYLRLSNSHTTLVIQDHINPKYPLNIGFKGLTKNLGFSVGEVDQIIDTLFRWRLNYKGEF